jgi:gliding motility-associated lipoprotein GldD
MNLRFIFSAFLISIFFGGACGDVEQVDTPKPRGYFRINFPEHTYKTFEPANCPYTFEIPTYATAIPDTNRFAEKCWYYLVLPKFNGQVYFTYKSLNNDLYEYTENTRTLVYKHTSRASSINENVITFSDGVSGILYDIGGDAASPLQFYVTDSTSHFLRGSLYFNAPPNSDSIAPVLEFVKKDILHLLKTVKWK